LWKISADNNVKPARRNAVIRVLQPMAIAIVPNFRGDDGG
jgi:hypothetical protein